MAPGVRPGLVEVWIEELRGVTVGVGSGPACLGPRFVVVEASHLRTGQTERPVGQVLRKRRELEAPGAVLQGSEQRCLHEVFGGVRIQGFGEAVQAADDVGQVVGSVDWEAVTRLDDESLIDGVSQIAPFDAASKQALLEAPTLSSRCELMVQLMQFFGRRDSDDGRVTLQ